MRFLRDDSDESREKAINGYTPDEIERGYRTIAYGPEGKGRKETTAVPTDVIILYELRQLRAEVKMLRLHADPRFPRPT